MQQLTVNTKVDHLVPLSHKALSVFEIIDEYTTEKKILNTLKTDEIYLVKETVKKEYIALSVRLNTITP